MKRAATALLFLIMLAQGLRINRFPLSRTRFSMMSKDWPTYLVEFRGTDPAFRFQEFEDAARSLKDGDQIAASILDYRTIVPELSAPLSPLCCSLRLPSDEVASEIIQKCSTVKRIIDVWGEGKTIKELCATSVDTFHKRIQPQLSKDDLRWRMTFERHGRIGPADKAAMCEQLRDVLILLGGSVDLKTPNLNLIYGEDCHTYHREQLKYAAKLRAEREAELALAATTTSTTTYTTVSNNTAPTKAEPFRAEQLASEQMSYTPLYHYFGRVVAEGPGIFTKFELRSRPFVGTTSMNAMCSHISAVAAQVQPGQRVLDPFCGTGSLLVAAAHLGADVVGSDLDADGLLGGGLTPSPTTTDSATNDTTDAVMSVLPSKKRSKNVNFQRKNGQNQLGLCTLDNFKHYNMTEKVLDLIGVGVDQWLLNANGSGNANRDAKVLKYDKFDAIIADPPFGRRERTLPSSKAFTRGSGEGSAVPSSMCVGTNAIAAERVARSAAASGTATSAVDESSATDTGDIANDTILPLFTPATNMGDNNSELITTLLQVSMCRLVAGGRLVLWLPSKANTPAGVVEDYLSSLIEAAESNASGDSGTSGSGYDVKPVLKLKRVTAETLNDSLWRWLCVFRFE